MKQMSDDYPSIPVVDVIIKDEVWHKIAFELIDVLLVDYVDEVARRVLMYAGVFERFISVEIVLLLTNDVEMRELNKKFRDRDFTTNVLSFPNYELYEADLSTLQLKPEECLMLGNIAVSYRKILDESLEQSKSFLEHFTHILIHSVLHLLGYDHIDDVDAEKMESIEIEILAAMDIKNPYVEEAINTSNGALTQNLKSF